MKIRDADPFFTEEVPVLTVRPSTPEEAAARAARWAESKALKFKRSLADADQVVRRSRRSGPPHTKAVYEPPLPPWGEVSRGWELTRRSFAAVFLDDGEAEQARLAYHEGGPRWLVWLRELSARRHELDRQTMAAEWRRRRPRNDGLGSRSGW